VVFHALFSLMSQSSLLVYSLPVFSFQLVSSSESVSSFQLAFSFPRAHSPRSPIAHWRFQHHSALVFVTLSPRAAH
jgi:hypothetical protein